MKSLLPNLFILSVTSVTPAMAREAIESARLDDRVVYLVPVATNRVTTISFPGPISAIDGAGVTTDPRLPGPIHLAHSKGTSFLSVRAGEAKASANLNVRWGQNTYVFQFDESAQPVLSFILESKPASSGVKPAPRLSPVQLLALLDKAKSFPLLKSQHPAAVADVDFASFTQAPLLSDFDDYEISIEEAFRFNSQDTVVFHLSLRSKVDVPIHYRPDSFKLRVGNRIYPQSISDAAGLIPPCAEVSAYFAVTGTPDGARNELSLKNDFTILVDRFHPVVTGPTNSTNSTNSTPATP